MTIPRKFECMGFTVEVDVRKMSDKSADGKFYPTDYRIDVSSELTEQRQQQTFWHEFMHCALNILGYEKIDANEQFVDQMGQLLYQLEKTRQDRKK